MRAKPGIRTPEDALLAAMLLTESTHSLAAQASAAYTILLLRGRYPNLGLGALIPVSYASDSTQETTVFQGLSGLACAVSPTRRLSNIQLGLGANREMEKAAELRRAAAKYQKEADDLMAQQSVDEGKIQESKAAAKKKITEAESLENAVQGPPKQAQKALSDWLNNLVAVLTTEPLSSEGIRARIKDVNNPLIEFKKANPEAYKNIENTVSVIQYFIENAISANKAEAFEALRRVLNMASIISATHPANPDKWGDYQLHWILNRFYHPQSGVDLLVPASPAEALNLLCAGMMDDQHCLVSPPDPSKPNKKNNDKNDRLDSIFKILSHLGEERESKNMNKCSGGLQHDLLFQFNELALDVDNKTPLHLLHSTDLFLRETLQKFLEEELEKIAQKNNTTLDALMLQWIEDREAHKENSSPFDQLSEEDEQLSKEEKKVKRDANQARRRDAAKMYLQSQAKRYGINPNGKELTDFLAVLEDVICAYEPRYFLKGATLIFHELAKSSPLTVTDNHPLHEVIQEYNRALEKLKNFQFSEKVSKEQSQMIAAFYSVQSILTALIKEHTLAIWSEDTTAQALQMQRLEIIEKIHAFLKDTFTSGNDEITQEKKAALETFDTQLLQQIYPNYAVEQAKLVASLHQHLIENFYVLLACGQNGRFAELKEMHLEGKSLHTLPKNALSAFLTKAAEGSAQFEPYELNRIFLYSMFATDCHLELTPEFFQVLIHALTWVSKPLPENPPPTLIERRFHEVYEDFNIHKKILSDAIRLFLMHPLFQSEAAQENFPNLNDFLLSIVTTDNIEKIIPYLQSEQVISFINVLGCEKILNNVITRENIDRILRISPGSNEQIIRSLMDNNSLINMVTRENIGDILSVFLDDEKITLIDLILTEKLFSLEEILYNFRETIRFRLIEETLEKKGRLKDEVTAKNVVNFFRMLTSKEDKDKFVVLLIKNRRLLSVIDESNIEKLISLFQEVFASGGKKREFLKLMAQECQKSSDMRLTSNFTPDLGREQIIAFIKLIVIRATLFNFQEAREEAIDFFKQVEKESDLVKIKGHIADFLNINDQLNQFDQLKAGLRVLQDAMQGGPVCDVAAVLSAMERNEMEVPCPVKSRGWYEL